MRTVFYTFLLRHRDDNEKYSFGKISRTFGEHARAMLEYTSKGSSKYDRLYDFGTASISKTVGLKDAPHSTHKSKAGSHKS